MAQVTEFVTVVQRRPITVDEELLPLVAPLFTVDTHMTMEERGYLMALSLHLPMGFVACEVGSYLGASTGFIATAASIRGGHLHCVDTWDNRAMWPEKEYDTYAAFTKNTERFAKFMTIHRGESVAVAPRVPDGLDLLFLDGDHSYESVKADLAAYGPKLKSGAILLLHDMQYDSVQRACSEYLAGRGAQEIGRTHNLQGYRV